MEFNQELSFSIPPEHIPTAEDMFQLGVGNGDVINRLIEGLMRFTVDMVTFFIRAFPNANPFKEDLIANGLLVLTEFVNSQAGSGYWNDVTFLNMLKTAIQRGCMAWLNENQTSLTIPDTTVRRILKEEGTLPERHTLREAILTTGRNDVYGEEEFDEMLSQLSPIEETIVRYKIEGKSNRFICQELNLHLGQLIQSLDQIREVMI